MQKSVMHAVDVFVENKQQIKLRYTEEDARLQEERL